MGKIEERLDKILDIIKEDNFLKNRGIGNEIGFYIFDYEPKHEGIVRKHTEFLIKQMKKIKPDVGILNISIYDIILEILQEKKLLDKCFDMEKKKGKEALHKAMKPIVKPEAVIDKIKAAYDENTHKLVFLTGIGSAWPLVRSHTILNNLHHVFDKIPLVAFFPGMYDCKELRLFGLIKDDNYYRAFQLVK
ncbi:MAG TPA: DUF1788 domain-containing protein [Candidatus Wallbacteria bacterium]|nr:DUF1788 domain-containing protein [Candidatus Wallbacteria bacterium]